MRILPRLLLLPAVCCAFLPVPVMAAEAGADEPVRTVSATAGVREAERLRAVALGQRDIDVLRRLISGDYYHVESNGRVRSKTEFLQALARNEFRLRDYGVDDMEINMVDQGGTAIVTGTYRVTVEERQAAQPKRGRYVRIWTRHPEGWRNALHQSTEIRPVAP
ncbi:nuclear transport factor 2 family protein [Telluria aromaticivorans]|uniref:Nuclear transport factor 2 family protein n=1 Tax=Telluria aromaticivorans TaxID=2725995 RepID=A0A7Y2JYG0_9BURK|nr:nuclear transport factor 2 family protein [Telluria aromaticivorans]NNG23312.1 nuclear transport factor 2 family protein [Telluria aromaticivorans]